MRADRGLQTQSKVLQDGDFSLRFPGLLLRNLNSVTIMGIYVVHNRVSPI